MGTPLIPFVVYSDGPHHQTGLARITRDLVSRLWAEREALGIDLLQVGYDPLPGLAMDWPVHSFASIPMGEKDDWGADQVRAAWLNYFGQHTGVLFSVWDPGRAYSLLGVPQAEQHWGYFPIDSTNVNDTLGGPARAAIERYTRVLAYTRWGSQVLGTIRKPVPYLPHGLDLAVWTPERPQEDFERAGEILRARPGEVVIGCVATNQPRKDLALFFATVALLQKRGYKVRAWLHTDTMVRAWAVQQLVDDFGLAHRVRVSLNLTDAELAACYACCGVTIAPGLGEGFGYPIVESLACGTPVVHGDFAGGAELVPLNAWRVPVHAERLEGIYAMRRPLFLPQDMANAVERALDWKRSDERVCQEYCRGAVEHLDWRHIWGRWRSWFKQGLEAY